MIRGPRSTSYLSGIRVADGGHGRSCDEVEQQVAVTGVSSMRVGEGDSSISVGDLHDANRFAWLRLWLSLNNDTADRRPGPRRMVAVLAC